MGNVTGLTDSSGTVVKTYAYEAFGNVLSQTGTVTNPYQFQTKHTSAVTGLVNFGFRSYNPIVGRFITADPLGFVNGPNVYAYVGNNPLNWIDPWGLCKDKLWWEKLGEGYYYGTGFGTEAAEWYAQQQLATGNSLWAIPGSVTSLWTPETYQQTAWTLITAGSLSGWAAGTSPWIGTAGIHPPHHGMGRHFELILKLGEKVFKVFIPGKDRWIYWIFK